MAGGVAGWGAYRFFVAGRLSWVAGLALPVSGQKGGQLPGLLYIRLGSWGLLVGEETSSGRDRCRKTMSII